MRLLPSSSARAGVYRVLRQCSSPSPSRGKPRCPTRGARTFSERGHGLRDPGMAHRGRRPSCCGTATGGPCRAAGASSRSAATRVGRPPCSAPPSAAAAGASSPSTPSSTAGSSAARRPATCSRRTSRRPSSTDAVELLPEYSTAARPTWTRPFDYLYIDGKHDYWTLSDDLQWSRAPARGRAGPDPRLLLVDRRHPRHPRPRAAVAPAALRAPGRVAGALPGRAAHRGATGCGSSRELPWWLRNVSSRCCCGCGCARWPRGLRARRPVRPLLSLVGLPAVVAVR